MQHDAAPDRGKIGTAVKRRDKPRQRTRRGKLGVVVQRRDDAAVAEIGATVAPAGDPVVAVQRDQGRIGPALDRGGETDPRLRPRPLIDDEDVTGDAGLRQRGCDRRHRLLRAVQRQDDDVGVIGAVRRTGCAGDPADHSGGAGIDR